MARVIPAALVPVLLASALSCARRESPTSTVNSAPAALPPPSPSSAAAAGANATAGPSAEPTPDPVTAPSALPAEPKAGSAALSNVSFRTSIEGCLSAADEAEMARFPANTRAAPSGVRLEPDAGGVRVVHRFGHACCLKSDTRVERQGSLLTLTERLSGTACRCRCSSALTTRIELQAGDGELRVVLDEGGRAAEVYRGPLPEPGSPAQKPKLPPQIQGTPKTR
jgi:hypothetical protein